MPSWRVRRGGAPAEEAGLCSVPTTGMRVSRPLAALVLKTIRLPSGDQAGLSSSTLPEVIELSCNGLNTRAMLACVIAAGIGISACSGTAADSSAECDRAVQELVNHTIYAGLLLERGLGGIEQVYDHHIHLGYIASTKARDACPSDKPGLPELLNTYDMVVRGEKIPHQDTPNR